MMRFEAEWAPIFSEPILGSGERLSIAIVGRSSDGTIARCLPLLTDKWYAVLANKQDADALREVAHIAMESVTQHVHSGLALKDWSAPLQGLSLGTTQNALTSDLDALLLRAATLVSVVFEPPSVQVSPAKQTRTNWHRDIGAIIAEKNQEFSRSVGVRVLLGKRNDFPVEFTFFNADYAVIIASFSPKRLKNKVELARAGLWQLDLLDDAASYIFKPKNRELLAGVSEVESDAAERLVMEAVEEIRDEAKHRNVSVTTIKTPEEAVDHIVRVARAA